MDRLRSFLTGIRLKLKGAKVGRNLKVMGPIKILLRDGGSLKNLDIGDNVTLGGRIYLRIRKNGKIVIGNGVRTGTEVWLVAANNEILSIGNNTILGSYNILNGGHKLIIGSDCIFAGFVYLNTSDHAFAKGKIIQDQGFFGAPIVIGDDVWLGGQVFINKGVNIGMGCVVGAGSVVKDNFGEYKIIAGNPAKVIKERV
jgi:acetyltransferase-like isoleucine patch superfamily enzyme